MEEFKLSNLRAGVPHVVATVEVDAATIRNQRYGRPFPLDVPSLMLCAICTESLEHRPMLVVPPTAL